MRRTRIVPVLVFVLAMTGCASVTSGARVAARPAAAKDATPHAQAAQEAQRILATFRPPAGAKRRGAVTGTALLQSPMSGPGTPNIVDDVQWWTLAGDPQAIVASVPTPTGATASGGASSGSSGGMANVAVSRSFDWPAGPVLDSRQLQVAAAQIGGTTVLRVDALVTWLPPRPANSLIPATAKVVSVSYTPASGLVGMQKVRRDEPITSTDPAVVAGVAAAVNAAPMQPPGIYHCPMSQGAAMSLVFSDSVGGSVVAKATVAADGCQTALVKVTGGGSATLSGGAALIPKIVKLMGVQLQRVVPQVTK